MAPKRGKSGVRVASASIMRFSSPMAEEEFNRLLSRPTIKERGFVPRKHKGLVAMIEELQWGGVCKVPSPVPINVVREFYANAKDVTDGWCMVRGRRVDFSPAAIRLLLGQPPKQSNEEEWVLMTSNDVDMEAIVLELCVPDTCWKYKLGTTEPLTFLAFSMNRFARSWYLFLCANIMPTTHVGEVTADRALVLWGLLKGKYIDVGYVIHQNILRFLKSPAQISIPHASIIAGLCMVSGVTWSADEDLQQPGPTIYDTSIDRMPEWTGGIPHPRGLGYDVSVAESSDQGAGTSGPGAGAPPQGSRVARYLDAHFRRLNRRIDALHTSNREYAEDLATALSNAGIQAQWPVYGARTIYPPPDSPEKGDSEDSE